MPDAQMMGPLPALQEGGEPNTSNGAGSVLVVAGVCAVTLLMPGDDAVTVTWYFPVAA